MVFDPISNKATGYPGDHNSYLRKEKNVHYISYPDSQNIYKDCISVHSIVSLSYGLWFTCGPGPRERGNP
jgi:hypothetical protein